MKSSLVVKKLPQSSAGDRLYRTEVSLLKIRTWPLACSVAKDLTNTQHAQLIQCGLHTDGRAVSGVAPSCSSVAAPSNPMGSHENWQAVQFSSAATPCNYEQQRGIGMEKDRLDLSVLQSLDSVAMLAESPSPNLLLFLLFPPPFPQ